MQEYIKHPQIPLTINSINEKLSQKFGVNKRKREFKKIYKKLTWITLTRDEDRQPLKEGQKG